MQLVEILHGLSESELIDELRAELADERKLSANLSEVASWYRSEWERLRKLVDVHRAELRDYAETVLALRKRNEELEAR